MKKHNLFASEEKERILSKSALSKLKFFPISKWQGNKKLILIGFCIFIFIFSSGIIFPIIFAKNYVKSQYPRATSQWIHQVKLDYWKAIWRPEYRLIEEISPSRLKYHNLTLKRKYLVWWQVARDDVRNISDLQAFSEDFKKEFSQGNMNRADEELQKMRADSVEAFNQVQFKPEPFLESQSRSAQRQVKQEFTDPNKKNEVVLEISDNPNENYVLINGKEVGALKNVSNLHFDLEGKHLYYSKYNLKHNIPEYSGKIFRYDVALKKEEPVYDFGQPIYVSFRANQEVVAYATLNKEVGVINLKTKDKQKADISSIKLVTGNTGSELPCAVINVVGIGKETAILEVNRDKKEFDGSYYRLNVQTVTLL